MTEDGIRNTLSNAMRLRAEFEDNIPTIRAHINRVPEGTSPIALPDSELVDLLSGVKDTHAPKELFVGGERYLISRDGGITEAPLPTPEQKAVEIREAFGTRREPPKS